MTISSRKMRALLKVGVALGVLVVLTLASVGAWEVYKGTVRLIGRAHADGVAEFIKCYALKPDFLPLAKGPGRVVLLDEIRPEGERVLVGAATLLCAPAKILLEKK
jgi:hypothetical protein